MPMLRITWPDGRIRDLDLEDLVTEFHDMAEDFYEMEPGQSVTITRLS